MDRWTRRIRTAALLLLAMPAIALAQQAYTNRSVNVRAGPDVQYPAVAVLPAGASVWVSGCLEGYAWCEVEFGEDRGFIFSQYLNYVYGANYVPLYSYAPTLGIPLITFSVGNYWDRWYVGRPWYYRRDYWVSRPPPPVYYRPPSVPMPPPRPLPPPRPDYRPPGPPPRPMPQPQPQPRPPQFQPMPGGPAPGSGPGGSRPPQGGPPPSAAPSPRPPPPGSRPQAMPAPAGGGPVELPR